jgi:hypothetical protein
MISITSKRHAWIPDLLEGHKISTVTEASMSGEENTVYVNCLPMFFGLVSSSYEPRKGEELLEGLRDI